MRRLNEYYYELIEQQLEKMDCDSMSGLEELLAFFTVHEMFFEAKNHVLLLMMEMHLDLLRDNMQGSQIFREINVSPLEYRRILRCLEKGVRDQKCKK